MTRSGPFDDPPRGNAPTALEAMALAWVARLDRGLSADEESEFERWLAADPRHAALFGEFDGTWALLERMQEISAPEASSPNNEYAPADARFGSATPVTGGAGGEATGAVPRPAFIRRSRGTTAVTFRLAVAALAAAAVFAFAFLDRSPPPTTAPDALPFFSTAGTRLGELRSLTLPDGSVVRLNTESAVEIHFSAGVRSIRLVGGEAHFTVAKDPTRPFVVSAAGVAVRALGTAFNVRVRAQAIEVLVTHGRVRVQEAPAAADPAATHVPTGVLSSAPAAPALRRSDRALSAGQAITIPRPGSAAAPAAPVPAVHLSAGEIERALAWQERRLEFISAPLAVMVEEFNRYNRDQLVIDDPVLAAQRFGGNFRADDPAGFVRVLESNFRVVAELRAGVTILRAHP